VLEAVHISNLARQALARATDGRVLHDFPAGSYVQTSAGDIVVIVSANVPLGPLSIAIRGAWAEATADRQKDDVRWTLEEMRLGDARIRLDRARLWDAVPRWDSLASGLLAPGMTRRLREALFRRAPPGSLAEVLRAPEGGSDLLVQAARSRAHAFASALHATAGGRAGANHALAEASASLAGLGKGFTPAGDDFMMGAMYAAWVALPPPAARRVGEIIVAAAAPQTTTVSAAYLRAASAGAASVGWHELVAGVREGDEPIWQAAVERLAAVGHTSGADALAGFIRGVEVVLHISPGLPSTQDQAAGRPAATIQFGQVLP
jgi:hypothetical protein